eukprot:2363649-Pyramimonas_sp.AAC.1
MDSTIATMLSASVNITSRTRFKDRLGNISVDVICLQETRFDARGQLDAPKVAKQCGFDLFRLASCTAETKEWYSESIHLGRRCCLGAIGARHRTGSWQGAGCVA